MQTTHTPPAETSKQPRHEGTLPGRALLLPLGSKQGMPVRQLLEQTSSKGSRIRKHNAPQRSRRCLHGSGVDAPLLWRQLLLVCCRHLKTSERTVQGVTQGENAVSSQQSRQAELQVA